MTNLNRVLFIPSTLSKLQWIILYTEYISKQCDKALFENEKKNLSRRSTSIVCIKTIDSKLSTDIKRYFWDTKKCVVYNCRKYQKQINTQYVKKQEVINNYSVCNLIPFYYAIKQSVVSSMFWHNLLLACIFTSKYYKSLVCNRPHFLFQISAMLSEV